MCVWGVGYRRDVHGEFWLLSLIGRRLILWHKSSSRPGHKQRAKHLAMGFLPVPFPWGRQGVTEVYAAFLMRGNEGFCLEPPWHKASLFTGFHRKSSPFNPLKSYSRRQQSIADPEKLGSAIRSHPPNPTVALLRFPFSGTQSSGAPFFVTSPA